MGEPILIDGSQGEGGGQILRTSLALSIVTGTPVTITNIRAGRAKPGLLAQHLTAAKAAAVVSGAELFGAELRSTSLELRPNGDGPLAGGHYHFDVQTAGSATLVLQTILPPLLHARTASEVTIEGGTHNPAAPPYPFLVDAFAPLLARMGGKLGLRLERAGFYPAGGGRIVARIEPVEKLGRFELLERGAITARYVRAVVSDLPAHVAQREIHTLLDTLGWSTADVDARPDRIEGAGRGNALVVTIACENVTEVFTAFGDPNLRAEAVARAAAEETKRWLDADVPIGEHLADQLVLPMALGGGGCFLTSAPSKHLQTQIDIVRLFTKRAITLEETKPGVFRVDVSEA